MLFPIIITTLIFATLFILLLVHRTTRRATVNNKHKEQIALGWLAIGALLVITHKLLMTLMEHFNVSAQEGYFSGSSLYAFLALGALYLPLRIFLVEKWNPEVEQA